jgi:hypothetical protein
MTALYIATEDALSEAVLERLIQEVNQGLRVAVRMGRKGNSYLKKKFSGLLKTAQAVPVLLLTDLDRIECPPSLIRGWRGKSVFPEGLLFRVAVREIEAWLLADRKGFAHFSGIPLDKMPLEPETLIDPKRELLRLIRKYGERDLKNAILPESGSSAMVGFGYNQALVRFVWGSWSVEKAAANAESLARTCRRIRELSLRV